MDNSEAKFIACAHRDLIAARNEFGEPQLWCRCGRVIECPPAMLKGDGGKVETGGALRRWNDIAATDVARRILAGRS